MRDKDIWFYSELPEQVGVLSDLFADEDSFISVPQSWYVIVTDIKGSTKAVQEGRHEEINLIATGSIIAALNIAKQENITIPFFFGGDGATLLVPQVLLDATMSALKEHQKNSKQNFDLDLRVGCTSVSEVYKGGCELMIAKAKVNEVLTIPIVLGEGLVKAEAIIKGDDTVDEYIQEEGQLNLSGMECRWDRVKPPKESYEVVCLLVYTSNYKEQAAIFKEVLWHVDDIYGSQNQRKPVSAERLKLKATFGKINTEMKAKTGKFSLGYLIKNFALTLFGHIYFKFDQKGKHYIDRLVELSDTLVIDGRINTVISGSSEQRDRLLHALQEMEEKGDIVFGMSVSSECVMSCYVQNRDDDHIHFIDGAGAGYTQAAIVLKQKLAQRK